MSLRMSRDMVPTVRLVAFLVFTDGTVVADSEVLRVVGRCSEVRKTTPTPTGADPEGGATGGGAQSEYSIIPTLSQSRLGGAQDSFLRVETLDSL